MHILSERSQSETIGVVLLTAVVVVVTTTAGVIILSENQSQLKDDPRADVTINATTAGIQIEHQGGDQFNASRIRVLVTAESGDQEFILAEDFDPVGGDSERFGPGDRWEQATGDSYSGELTIQVVDTEGGKILQQKTVVVE